MLAKEESKREGERESALLGKQTSGVSLSSSSVCLSGHKLILLHGCEKVTGKLSISDKLQLE